MGLKFPDSVGSPECPAFIRFTPEEVEYGGKAGLNNIGRTPNPANAIARGAGENLGLAGTITPIADKVGAALGGAVDGFISDAVGSIQGSINDALGDFAGAITIGGLGQTSSGGGAINLFLPDGLATNSSVSYRKGGGILSTTIAGATGKGEASFQDAMKAMSENSKELLKELGIAAINEFTGEAGQDVLAMTEGKVANNFSFMFFDSVDHRTFDYTFECIPRNGGEASSLKAICDEFLANMLPTREGGFYNIPPQWDIKYVGANLLQPKKCFLQSVNVSYNDGAGRAIHDDQNAYKTTINLSFIEIEPLYAE